MNLQANDKVRIRFTRLLETVTFTARITKIESDSIIVRIPDNIRKMQWTVYPGKYYRFPIKDFVKV